MFIVSSKFYVAVVQPPSVKYLTLLQYCSRHPIAHQLNTLWWGYWLGFITMLYSSSTSRCLHVSRVYVMSEDFILFLFTWFCAHLSPPWQSIKTVLLILRLRYGYHVDQDMISTKLISTHIIQWSFLILDAPLLLFQCKVQTVVVLRKWYLLLPRDEYTSRYCVDTV